jgi:multidrug efflux pump subunit AcrB
MLNTVLGSSTGQKATLGSLSHIIRIPGQTEIQRDNLQPDVAVTARLEGIDLGSAMEAIQVAVAKLNLLPAIRAEYGGAHEEQQRSFRDLALAARGESTEGRAHGHLLRWRSSTMSPHRLCRAALHLPTRRSERGLLYFHHGLLVLVFAVVLVFIVLLFEFGGFAAPVAILSSALLSTSGVFVALLIMGKTFNISSFMGLIMVIGIVAKNGILLLDADKKYRKEGLDPEEAMIKAGERRLRPILMTALATIAGMVPLSLAIAVIGGIVASMALSLIVTPAVNYYLTRPRPLPRSRLRP